jgi:hypothetical protein
VVGKLSILGRETWILLVTALASGGAAAAIAWYVRDHKREPEDVTIGFIGPTLAAMYLLVLALALATEWQTIGSAQQAVGSEAVAVRQIYWAASALPPAAGNTLRVQVRSYVATVVDHDWPEMEHGTLDDASLNQLTAMSTSLLQVNSQTSEAANAQAYATGQLGALVTARTQRESAAESRLPVGILVAVVLTSLIVGLFPFAGAIRSEKASIGVAVLQAVLVAVTVVVVFQLNNPFTGPLGTGPGPISAVAAEIGARLASGANESRPPVGLRGIPPRSDTAPGRLFRACLCRGRAARRTEHARDRARRLVVTGLPAPDHVSVPPAAGIPAPPAVRPPPARPPLPPAALRSAPPASASAQVPVCGSDRVPGADGDRALGSGADGDGAFSSRAGRVCAGGSRADGDDTSGCAADRDSASGSGTD